MSPKVKPSPGTGAETRMRIARSAQSVFSERGYSQTRIQDVAARAGIASSLVIKYFGRKANLFREALKLGLEGGSFQQDLKPRFGTSLVNAVKDPELEMFAPAMIALSLGDDEARSIVREVVRDHIGGRLATWLGPPDAETRAAEMVMLSMGFAIFARHLDIDLPDAVRSACSDWAAQLLQQLADGPAPEHPALRTPAERSLIA